MDVYYKALTDKKIIQQKAYEYPALLSKLHVIHSTIYYTDFKGFFFYQYIDVMEQQSSYITKIGLFPFWYVGKLMLLLIMI